MLVNTNVITNEKLFVLDCEKLTTKSSKFHFAKYRNYKSTTRHALQNLEPPCILHDIYYTTFSSTDVKVTTPCMASQKYFEMYKLKRNFTLDVKGFRRDLRQAARAI